MNPSLENLQLYPFQKLTRLFEDLTPADPSLTSIGLHIGEPRHSTPEFIRQELISNLEGLARYPTVLGADNLRTGIAAWLMKRYHLPSINPDTEVIPVNGSREALFAFAQAIIDTHGTSRPAVVCQNPFYQIYEGAALLAGATPYFLNQLPENSFSIDTTQLPDTVWERTQLAYICSPNNPTGKVLTLDEWKHLFDLSDRYGFVIAADECYSEIYFDEAHPPLGALEAAEKLGRSGFPRLVVFSSLSKRSNVPGMRSGFVAGDATILKKFLLYRTYHGSAMNPAVQAASTAAWSDEQHVIENRILYREKFAGAMHILGDTLPVSMPDAGFYLWLRTPISGIDFSRRLYCERNIIVLPGSYLAREAHGINPGEDFVRIALVATVTECMEAMERIRDIAGKF
ncbi:succinyldiaminopimelate transaminase [Nitrosomonas sp.]|uniref:succinyldiaminopimelate transaminase n=1 Tax=Nitrosomonas sp. TaxID=42353 RepID=UPI0025DD703E|nr:succinyldiaminopimelate transaminase [Nitrosomonas sp.]MCC6917422.1 succinyldiaminopimelate transaminase [Nitrosomonas sp.]